MDRCDLVRDPVDARVVAGIETDQKVGVIYIWKIFQDFSEDTRSQLGCSAGRRGHLCQGQFFGHAKPPKYQSFVLSS